MESKTPLQSPSVVGGGTIGSIFLYRFANDLMTTGFKDLEALGADLLGLVICGLFFWFGAKHPDVVTGFKLFDGE